MNQHPRLAERLASLALAERSLHVRSELGLMADAGVYHWRPGTRHGLAGSHASHTADEG